MDVPAKDFQIVFAKLSEALEEERVVPEKSGGGVDVSYEELDEIDALRRAVAEYSEPRVKLLTRS